jgi:hypothetical protein
MRPQCNAGHSDLRNDQPTATPRLLHRVNDGFTSIALSGKRIRAAEPSTTEMRRFRSAIYFVDAMWFATVYFKKLQGSKVF